MTNTHNPDIILKENKKYIHYIDIDMLSTTMNLCMLMMSLIILSRGDNDE